MLPLQKRFVDLRRGDKIKNTKSRDSLSHLRGRRLVLLTAERESDMANIVANNGATLSSWFEELRPWKKKDIGGSRVAMIHYSGIPLHV
ncbi:hypothetical protein Ancab_022167 [Ancistrocladus abbreviatus]